MWPRWAVRFGKLWIIEFKQANRIHTVTNTHWRCEKSKVIKVSLISLKMAFLFVSPQNLFTVIAEEASSAPRYLIAFLFMFASKSNETKQIDPVLLCNLWPELGATMYGFATIFHHLSVRYGLHKIINGKWGKVTSYIVQTVLYLGLNHS